MAFLQSFKALHISNRATKYLHNIASYTQKTWGIKQKIKYLSQLHQGFQELCLNSNLGVIRNDIQQGIHSFLVEEHMILYLSIENTLQIVRVLHQSMDVERHLS
ncbi:MAG: type II toxin-antitoxin system RelE/ParE family toxin [Mariprofundaceae bacterium]